MIFLATVDSTTGSWALFFGRFHPVMVHLPIGLVFAAACVEGVSRFQKFRHIESAVLFLWLLAALSAIPAAVCGWLVATGGGYDDILLFRHRWLGIGLAVLCMAMVGLKWKARQAFGRSAMWGRIYIPMAGLAVILLGVTSHFGGSLTHGGDYLTRYFPLGKGPGSQSEDPQPSFFAHVVEPMLAASCYECHGPEKNKGGLRLDSQEALLDGGDSGPLFVPGNRAQSEIYYRITLSQDDEDFMPPKGDVLTEYQIAIIGWWIDHHASFTMTMAKAKMDPELAAWVEK